MMLWLGEWKDKMKQEMTGGRWNQNQNGEELHTADATLIPKIWLKK